MANKLEFHAKLYLGEGIKRKNLDKIKEKLENKPIFSSVYLIVIAGNPDDQLEIFRARQLAQKFYGYHPCHVVGIASDYGDALKLVTRITQECLTARGDCKLKEYLIC